MLEVETRNLKGPRTYEASGLPLHNDNESIAYIRRAVRSHCARYVVHYLDSNSEL